MKEYKRGMRDGVVVGLLIELTVSTSMDLANDIAGLGGAFIVGLGVGLLLIRLLNKATRENGGEHV